MKTGSTWIINLHGIRRERIPDGERLRNRWIDLELFTGILDRLIECPENHMELSFDDGNRSDLELALPELKKRDLRATFFIIAGHIGRPGHLGPEEIRTLHAEGMRIGSHGMRHLSWRGLPESIAHQEFVQSRTILEELLGAEVREAACPFGLYNQRTLKQLRQAGYQRVFCSNRGPARTRNFLQARNTVHGHSTPEGVLGEKNRYRLNPVRETRMYLKRFRYQKPALPDEYR